MEQEWEELKENYEEFKSRVSRIKKGVEEEIEKTLKQADEYYNELKEWWLSKTSFHENPELNQGIFQRESTLLQTEINKAIAILQGRALQQGGSLSITGQVADYHQNLVAKQMDELKNKSPFEQKLFQYCYHDTKDEKYKEYGKYMQEFYDFRLRNIRTENDYLAHHPEYYLDRIGKTRTMSFLQDDDISMSTASSLYKAPRKKGWFG